MKNTISRSKNFNSKTRRSFGAIGALMAASLLLAACSNSGSSPANAADNKAEGKENTATQNAQSDQLARIKAAGELRIGLEGTYKPYSFHDESGKLTGFETDIAALIAQDLGVKPVYLETKFDSLIAGLDVDRYDIVINDLSPTPERMKKYDFSIPYIRTIGKIGVPEDSPLKSVADIKGKTSAQTAASNWATEVEKLGATLVPTNGFNDSIELLNTGRADATANSLVTFETYLKDNPKSKVRLLEGDLPINSISAILVPKGADSLRKAINDSLEKHIASKDLGKIFEKYVSADLTPTPEEIQAFTQEQGK